MEQKNKLDSVIGYALNNRSKSHNLKKGISKHTEHYAYEEVLPRLEGDNENLEMIALRLSAIIAASNIPQNDKIGFGRWAYKTAGANNEGVKARLMQLVNLDTESALTAVNRIIAMNNDNLSGFNWYGLARTFIFWGNGQSEESLKTRQSILREFFMANRIEEFSKKDEDEKKESESSE